MTGSRDNVEPLPDLVVRARAGDLEAYGHLMRTTQVMAYAVALRVLRDSGLAEDAVQESYLRAYRRLGSLDDASAFAGWLRRIVITVALNMRRTRRVTLLCLDEVDVPVLDESETTWSDAQRHRLAAALLTLTSQERRLCDRRYYGRWSVARLARDAEVDEPAMRKRLQRVRDKLRREVEMSEQREIRPEQMRSDLPTKVVELLARPQLTELPENPVGRIREQLRGVFEGFDTIDLPEVVDFTEARKTIGDPMLYIDPIELHRVDENRILRYDLTMPLMLTVKFDRSPVRVWSSGKVYRRCQTDDMHLEAFHQAEVLWVDDRTALDPWRVTAQVLRSVETVLPRRVVKLVPTSYPMCTQAWELEVETDSGWSEVLAWGVFTDDIVRHLGANPVRHTAIGIGYGLERLAMVRYQIDDIRKIEVASVA
jgi:RNA polymerase sigma-70 factor, ECF subfamily